MSVQDRATKQEKTGLVFDIERFAIHDGPGIRTAVFTKGCPLQCIWCANPEGINPYPELVFIKEKCIGCDECIEACPQQAIARDKDGNLITDREKCITCGTCSSVCSAKARLISGKDYSVAEVLSVVEKDNLFYKNSNGGVTISGGCPSAQSEFTFQLLKESKNRGLHTALETCGLSNWKNLKRILEFTDHLYFDIKCMDSETHRLLTGMPNEVILNNAKKASEFCLAAGKTMIIRVPIVPGYTDSETNIRATVQFVDEQLKGVETIELLPYHRLGSSKYDWLDREYVLKDVEPLDGQQVQRLKCAAQEASQATGCRLRIEIR